MEETASERLKRRRLELGFKTAAEAARRHNWDPVTYRSHENNSRGTGIPKWAAEKYAAAYKVTMDWLFTGVESRMLSLDSDAHFPKLGLAVRLVPVVALSQTRQLVADLGQKMPLDGAPKIPVVISKPMGPRAFAFRFEDDALKAETGRSFPRGDLGVFDPDAPVEPGDFCLAEVEGQPFPVARRYMEEAIGVVRLEPLNPAYRTYWIKEGSPGTIIARLATVVLDGL